MNTAELISAAAKRATATTGSTVSHKTVREVLDAVKEVVYDTVATEDVRLFDSLILSATYKEAHEAKDPRNGQPIHVNGKYQPKAKFGKAYKDALNRDI